MCSNYEWGIGNHKRLKQKEAIMYLEIFLWLRKYQKWIKLLFRWLFWSNNSNGFNLQKYKGDTKLPVTLLIKIELSVTL